jgi:hypothetical protein
MYIYTVQDHRRVERGVTFKRYKQEFEIKDHVDGGFYCEALTESSFCRQGDCRWFPRKTLVRLVSKSQFRKNLNIY